MLNKEAVSEHFNLLKYDEEKQGYHMDAVMGTDLQKIMGNLTGLGPIPTDDLIRREMNLALELNSYFKRINELIPDIAWLYYTSDSGFINIYPFVSSNDFFYQEKLKNTSFFSYASPNNNPNRDSVWTPVYLDEAGKGLMVTYSCPLYKEDDFLGIISLDFTNQYLSNVLYSKYEGYVVDQMGALIASSRPIKTYNENLYVRDVMKYSAKDWEAINAIKQENIKIISGDYVFKSNFENAPWTMYFRLPIWRVAVRAFILTLPVLIICLLFTYALYEIERRKRIQRMLSDTLKERKEYQDLLENAARYDFLTSTLNRRGMEEMLSKIDAEQMNKAIYILMADLDKFKKLNDTYGHEAGDKVLVEVAKSFKENLEGIGYVSRWGGEEFLLIVTDAPKEEVLYIAEDIRKKVEDMRIRWKDNVELKVTVTLGVAQYDTQLSLYQGISNADQALYQGKRNGRNQVVIYHKKETEEE
jgi:diguanylate cyclase (GGDEF)-like protein